jgi:hypothetical protein
MYVFGCLDGVLGMGGRESDVPPEAGVHVSSHTTGNGLVRQVHGWISRSQAG